LFFLVYLYDNVILCSDDDEASLFVLINAL